MGHRFADLLFSEPVLAMQAALGSRESYAKWDRREDFNDTLTAREIEHITTRESMYMATVSPSGWPYIQHRGGPSGFIKILDERHIGFADYRGNRQYISTGHLHENNRVTLFFMDYARRRRLKMLGHVEELAMEDPRLAQRLLDKDYPAKVERGFIIQVAAFDWNCAQHIPDPMHVNTP